MSDLIESTGYSYSGVADLIRNSDDPEVETHNLLLEIDKEYNLAKAECKRLTEKLKKKQANRANMVSMFLYVHKVINNEGDLVFQKSDEITLIKKIDENTIDYNKIELTDFSKLNK